jgi:DNA-3-methyladenine glycosylase I
MKTRCAWCGDHPLDKAYHDREWGVSVHDDRRLFEFLILEGAQAGLSWQTILKKREGYRSAFDRFDIQKVAAYTDKDIERLRNDPGIVRNRLKIGAAIKNAQCALAVIEEFGSLDAFFWRYVDGIPVQNRWRTIDEVPANTDCSDTMSKALKKRGFSFVGSTICYAFMQAVGMVNDHTTDCFRHRQIKELNRKAQGSRN